MTRSLLLMPSTGPFVHPRVEIGQDAGGVLADRPRQRDEWPQADRAAHASHSSSRSGASSGVACSRMIARYSFKLIRSVESAILLA